MRLLSPLCAPDCSYWLVRRSVGHMFTLVFVSCHALGTTLANTRLTTTMALFPTNSQLRTRATGYTELSSASTLNVRMMLRKPNAAD